MTTMTEDERRGLERRLDMLERKCSDLDHGLQRVEIEQGNAKELFKSNFTALYKGQELVLAKIEALNTLMNAVNSAPESSATGRALLREIGDLKERNADREVELGTLTKEIADLKAVRDRLTGAMWIASGAAGTAAVAALKAFGFLPHG